MISIVVPVFNEEAVLLTFIKEVWQVLQANIIDAEIIFVNDGSTDNTFKQLKDIHTELGNNVKAISFSRNFGHEAAMIAGIDYAKGDAIICMDSDLQHPPSLIPEMLTIFNEGHDIINMVRGERKDNGWMKNKLSNSFYWLINRLSGDKLQENASDFFLISKRVADLLRNNYRERNRFLRGFIQIVGFSKFSIPYVAPERVAGESKYSFFKLLKLSINAIISFSKSPLYLGIYIGGLFAALSLALIIYSLIVFFWGNTPPSGYTTIIIFMAIGFSIMFLLIGIIGIYVGYIFEENKKRPIYIIDELI